MSEARRKTRLSGTFRVEPMREQAISSLAALQHGVFALAHLIAIGLSPGAVRKRVAAGRLHRIHQGVYALTPPTLLSRNGRLMAAVLACGVGAALCHCSAGALLELT